MSTNDPSPVVRQTPRDYAQWWLKFCKAKCECDSITLEFRASEDGALLYHMAWFKIAAGEIPLPDLDGHDSVYCKAQVNPEGLNGYFGLCYGEQICCKHYDFDNQEDHTVSKDDTDEWKCTSRKKVPTA